MKQKFFRKRSLEQLSSPEQLDRLMTITSPAGWLALLGLGLVLAGAIVWSILGVIPVTVDGQGFLVGGESGLFDVYSKTSGQIYDFRLKPGDAVEEGQVVARVRQQDQVGELEKRKKQLADSIKKYEVLKENTQAGSDLKKRHLEMQEQAYRTKLQGLKSQLAWQENKVESFKSLADSGVISRQNLMDELNVYDARATEVVEVQSRIKELAVERRQYDNEVKEKLIEQEHSIRELETSIETKQEKIQRDTVITSPLSGHVVSVVAELGSLVQPGSPVLSLSLEGQNTQALSAATYVSAEEVKLIRPMTRVQISPAQAKKEEYGYIEGLVLSVSLYPASPEEIENVLHNKAIVQELTANAAPFKVMVELIPSGDEANGYRWSSSKGRELALTEGTRCTATFIVRNVRPISLVIPLFRKYVLGD